MALRHVRRQLQRSEIYLGREGTAQAASFPEVRNEIVALKKLEQEQKEVALRIAQIEDALKTIESERAGNARAQSDATAKLEQEKKPILQRRDEAKHAAAVCERELAGVEARLQANDSVDRELLRQLSALQAQAPPPPDLDARTAELAGKRTRLPQERAEIVRAREGSAEACRQATQRLAVAENELSAAERNFYFVIFSIFILVGVALLLVFQSPPKREWLPRETDAILSLNAERFDRDDLPKKWRNEDFWLQTWPGLIGAASQTPRLRIPADTSRVTRALTTAENSPPREFLLVEARDSISSVVRTISEDKQFEKRTISGLPVWQRSDFSIARVGPKTLAVGLPDGVDELVRVRL